MSLKRLVRCPSPVRTADVDRLEGIFVERGFEVHRGDLESAYRAWSEDAAKQPWLPLCYRSDQQHFDALIHYLTEPAAAAPAPEPAPPPAAEPPVPESTPDAALVREQGDGRAAPQQDRKPSPDRDAGRSRHQGPVPSVRH